MYAHKFQGGSKTNTMALFNWILLIALVVTLAHMEQQPMTSFTNGVLEFTNSTCARVLSSWDSLVLNAKAVDDRMLAFENQIFDFIVKILERVGVVVAFNRIVGVVPDLYDTFLNRMCH